MLLGHWGLADVAPAVKVGGVRAGHQRRQARIHPADAGLRVRRLAPDDRGRGRGERFARPRGSRPRSRSGARGRPGRPVSLRPGAVSARRWGRWCGPASPWSPTPPDESRRQAAPRPGWRAAAHRASRYTTTAVDARPAGRQRGQALVPAGLAAGAPQGRVRPTTGTAAWRPTPTTAAASTSVGRRSAANRRRPSVRPDRRLSPCGRVTVPSQQWPGRAVFVVALGMSLSCVALIVAPRLG